MLAVPAWAQTAVTAKVTRPDDGQVVSGGVSTGASGYAAAGVKSVKLFLEDTQVASAEPSNLRQNVDVDYTWDTTNNLSGGVARNGWYQLRTEVVANGGATATSKVGVMVDNAPQIPSGLESYVQDKTASLSWSPNPEPDLTGYRVEIARGGVWSVAAEVTTTSYEIDLEPGSYDLRVSAVRSSPNSSAGHASAPTAATSLTIQAPETAASSFGGGGRGATGGGDPRIYGRDGAASTKEVKATARAFSSGGLSFGGMSLPGSAGLPPLPGSTFEWGTYKEKLPYSLPQGGIPLDSVPPRLAAMSTTKIIPMDALRWVGAGALMIVIAMMLQFVGWRAETIAKLGAEGSAVLKLAVPKVSLPKVSLEKISMWKVPLRKPTVPAVNFTDALVRIRRIEDRVRAAWKEARRS
jgi:hypothetical protein